MKIMYLLFSFTVGGTEKLVADISNEMAKDNEIYLYIVNDLYDSELLNMISDQVHIVLNKRAAGAKNKLKTILRLSKFIRKNKIEIIHCNAFYTPELLLLHRFMFKHVKIYYTVHGVGQYCKLSRLGVWYRNHLCNSIIAISKSVAQDIIAFGADKRKVIIVYNAINLDKFTQFSTKKFDADNIIIGNIARISPENKGQDILINAIGILKNTHKNIQCYLAGAADSFHENDFKQLKKIVFKNNLMDNIHFIGNVHDVPKFLQKIDIFVLPSRFEGFGISLIEAMAMQIPCISSDINGPREIIGEEERGLLFKSEDAADLAYTIENAINNYYSLNDKTKAAYQYVKDNFDIKLMCKKLSIIYKA